MQFSVSFNGIILFIPELFLDKIHETDISQIPENFFYETQIENS